MVTMERFRQRLQRLREQRGISARRLSLAIGKSDAYVQALESGLRGKRLPGHDVIEALARELAVSTETLVGEEESAFRAVVDVAQQQDDVTDRLLQITDELQQLVSRRVVHNLRQANVGTLPARAIPVANAIAANEAMAHGRQIEESIMISGDLLIGIVKPVAFVVVGDCLRAALIASGDYLIVDAANTTPRQGEIVAARLNGEETAKCYFHLGNRIELRAASSGYPVITVLPGDDFEVIGVYAGVIRVGQPRS